MKSVFNNPNFGSSDIPVWVIVLALIFSPPIGIVLIILRAIWSAEDKSVSKSNSTNTNKKKKSVKSLGSGVRFILYALSVFLLLSGVGTVSDIADDPAFRISFFSIIDTVLPFVLSGSCFFLARSHKRRAERCDLYLKLINDSPYFSLTALAAASGVSYRRTQKDIQYMIGKKMLGESAFVDMGKKMFFSSQSAAEEYEKSAELKNLEDEKQAEDKVPKDEYRKIILDIRRLNDEIADIAVSDRIYKIEEITSNIFDYVKEHPEKKGSIRMFMNYYLPTTLKLLGSYANIEKVGVAGDNMRKSKESIEETLDMLVFAFKKELDSLYESESIDISSDIEVLEKMLKKDGMTKGWTDDIYSSDGTAAAEDIKNEEV